MRRLPTVLGLLVLAAAAAPALAAGPPLDLVGERSCRFADARISESSGLATSTDGSVLWTHNDSGDAPRWFAVDPTTCGTVGAFRLDLPVPSVPELGSPVSIDWEDMARGTAADGAPVLLFADIGDNPQLRAPGVTVYEVDEPARPRTADPAAEQPVAVRAVYQLRYPGPPKDAEALAQLPDGRLVVVTKDRALDNPGNGTYTGRSEVYASAGRPGPGLVRLTKVADLDVRALPGADPQRPATLAVTGADATRDGSRIVVRTLTSAYVFDVPAGDLAAAFGSPPQTVPLLPTKQGEAVAWTADGTGFRTSTEGTGRNDDAHSGAIDAYLPRTER